MQFQRIRVQNWRCFSDESVRFDDGVTVLYGNNGSGKSSLLEAAFFALYGSNALETGTTMSDVVTTDEDTAQVTLSFAHQGESYEVTREIRIRTSTTQSADLTTPPGQPDLDQISAIDELIQEELRLNAEDFLNSAYVQQGDVSRLIEATPKQRQRIIDNLLQMSKLERYRERMDSIETGVSRVVSTKNDQVDELTTQIAEYNETKIQSRKQQLHGFESSLENKRKTITNKIKELENDRADYKEIISKQKDLQQNLNEAENTAEANMTDLASGTSEYQSLQEDFIIAKNETKKHQKKVKSLLSVGEGDLTREFGATEDIVDKIAQRASIVVTDTLENATGDGRLVQSETEARDIATTIMDEANSETKTGTTHTADDLLEDLPTATAPLTPAVTGKPHDGSRSTIETTDEINEVDVDPLINPDVEVDASRVRVPTLTFDSNLEDLKINAIANLQKRTKATVGEIRDRLQAVEAAAANARSEANHLEQDAQEHNRAVKTALTGASSKLSDIANIREGRNEISDKRKQLYSEIEDSAFDVASEHTDLDAVLQGLIDTLEHRIARLESERARYRDKAARLGERIEQADRLLEDGKCPECGRPVENAPNVEHREQWEDERDYAVNLAEAFEEGIKKLQTRQDKAAELLNTTQSLYGEDIAVTISGADEATNAIQVNPNTNLTPLHEEAAEYYLKAREERQAAQEKQFQAVVQYLIAAVLDRAAERTLAHLTRALARKELVNQIKSAIDDRTEAERNRELAKSQLEAQANEVIDTHTDLQNAIRKHSSAAESFHAQTLTQAKENVNKINNNIEDLKKDLESLRTTERAVSEHIGDIRRQLTELNNLRNKRDARQREATAISALNSQVTELEEMFVSLRADLREQNVHRLEDLLQEVFDTLYRNDAYSDIKLDREYDATLIEKGGGELPPTKLSGGESAVFNLALRGAIYRLLTEGFEDDVPMPPLILDEPTAHLDDGHVDRLNDVVEAMRTAGVKQTIVVSHDEGLIDSADQRVQVRQRQGTNRSVAEPETTPSVEF